METDKDRRRDRKTEWGRNKRDRERETGKSGRQAGRGKERQIVMLLLILMKRFSIKFP